MREMHSGGRPGTGRRRVWRLALVTAVEEGRGVGFGRQALGSAVIAGESVHSLRVTRETDPSVIADGRNERLAQDRPATGSLEGRAAVAVAAVITLTDQIGAQRA